MKKYFKSATLILIGIIIGGSLLNYHFTHDTTHCQCCGEPYNIHTQLFKDDICDICHGYKEYEERHTNKATIQPSLLETDIKNIDADFL